jgi:hypothetical protein
VLILCDVLRSRMVGWGRERGRNEMLAGMRCFVDCCGYRGRRQYSYVVVVKQRQCKLSCFVFRVPDSQARNNKRLQPAQNNKQE